MRVFTHFLPAALGLLSVVGCGSNGPPTHVVRGKIELAGGDVKLLAGSHVEAALTSDPAVRASGQIQDDGAFRLETIHAGAILNGAREGTYRVRIILTDDDREARRRAAKVVAARFLDFRTSGLSFQAPLTDELTLAIGPR